MPLSRIEDRDTGWLEALIRNVVLAIICLVAFAIRLFSVVKWESVIHEFDPQVGAVVCKIGTDCDSCGLLRA
jgi:hypothetical protein